MSFDSSRRGFLAGAIAAPAILKAAPAAPAPKLAYRTLGRTGLKVTTVGFGCMVTADPSVIEHALDAGINYFDTARVYGRGNNERMVGAALGAKRKDVIVSSKSVSKTKEAALADLDTSLKELKTDYLDIWYLHSKNDPADILPELLEAQAIAKKAGKIRFPGLSLHNGHQQVIPAVIKTGAIDVVLVTYNFAMGSYMEDLLKSMHDAKMGVVAMKVIAGSFAMDKSYDYTKSREILKQPGAPLAALKYALRNPYVHTAIPSIVDNDQLEVNLKAMSEPFEPTDQKILTAYNEHIRPLYCRMCDSCSGQCPKGLPVSDLVRYAMYVDGYGQFSLGRENFQTMPAHLQSVRCSDCSGCAVKCPNGVAVKDRLMRAQELFA
jgi:aryl-alcohol dehydrogenase-like predicted oxidoreductase